MDRNYKIKKRGQKNDFWDPKNEEGLKQRQEVFQYALNDLINYLKNKNGTVKNK
jgi:hypothetical protein